MSGSTGVPYACLTACAQSHIFDDRRIAVTGGEEDAVKVGRAVARWKPGNDNAIFDCKVLSRNHAVLWYEDGRFYLRDTKSSNGTFVNNERLSKGGEESAPRQLFSGDILQFGVDIIENTNKVTHGCIVAMLRLFDENGLECGGSECPVATLSAGGVTNASVMDASASAIISQHQLFQLQQYIREAAHRERVLEQKLALLQGVLTSTQDASEKSWQALINEDRLLSRIEILEAQLAAYAKTANHDQMRDEMIAMQEEKQRFETMCKESLRRVLQERTEALQRLADVERSLETTEEECASTRARCDQLDAQLLIATNAQTTMAERVALLTRQLDESEKERVMVRERENDLIGEKKGARVGAIDDNWRECVASVVNVFRRGVSDAMDGGRVSSDQLDLLCLQLASNLVSIASANDARNDGMNRVITVESHSKVDSQSNADELLAKYEQAMRLNLILQEKYDALVGATKEGDLTGMSSHDENDGAVLLVSAIPLCLPLLIVLFFSFLYRFITHILPNLLKRKKN